MFKLPLLQRFVQLAMLKQSDEGTAYAARRLLGELRLGANVGFVPVLRKSTLGALGGKLGSA